LVLITIQVCQVSAKAEKTSIKEEKFDYYLSKLEAEEHHEDGIGYKFIRIDGDYYYFGYRANVFTEMFEPEDIFGLKMDPNYEKIIDNSKEYKPAFLEDYIWRIDLNKKGEIIKLHPIDRVYNFKGYKTLNPEPLGTNMEGHLKNEVVQITDFYFEGLEEWIEVDDKVNEPYYMKNRDYEEWVLRYNLESVFFEDDNPMFLVKEDIVLAQFKIENGKKKELLEVYDNNRVYNPNYWFMYDIYKVISKNNDVWTFGCRRDKDTNVEEFGINERFSLKENKDMKQFYDENGAIGIGDFVLIYTMSQANEFSVLIKLDPKEVKELSKEAKGFTHYGKTLGFDSRYFYPGFVSETSDKLAVIRYVDRNPLHIKDRELNHIIIPKEKYSDVKVYFVDSIERRATIEDLTDPNKIFAMDISDLKAGDMCYVHPYKDIKAIVVVKNPPSFLCDVDSFEYSIKYNYSSADGSLFDDVSEQYIRDKFYSDAFTLDEIKGRDDFDGFVRITELAPIGYYRIISLIKLELFK
jgi:hypothetical protein